MVSEVLGAPAQTETQKAAGDDWPDLGLVFTTCTGHLRAWQWALSEREATTGALASGKVIADHFGRREPRGRLVKQSGLAGRL